MHRNISIFNSIFDFATEGIIVSNIDGEIVLANPKSHILFGYEKDELIGLKVEVLIPLKHRTNHVEHRNSFTANPRPRTMGMGMELSALRKDGSEFPVEVSLSHFTDDNKMYVLSYIIDHTIRKEQDAQIKEAYEKLSKMNNEVLELNSKLENRVKERTEELEIAIQRLAKSQQELIVSLDKEKSLNDLKSRFITTASHEFRTPLGTILSSAALAMKYDDDKKEQRHKHLERIKISVKNLTQILNDFLSMDKLDEGLVRNFPEPIEVQSFINDLIDEMENFLRQGQKIIFEKCKINSVKLDKHLLKNSMLNLLSNGIKYSKENSEITIRVEQVDNKVILAVKDNGIGIPKDEQAYLFDRFFRAKNAINIQGTGLGLSIVQRYTQIMGGELKFTSDDNGTEFQLIFDNDNEKNLTN